MKWLEGLRLKPCEEAITWAKQFESLQDAWNACRRPDWMFWLIAKTAINNREDKKRVVLATCGCVWTALVFTRDDPSVSRCVELAETWARGKATIAEVDDAAREAAEAESRAQMRGNVSARYVACAAQDAADAVRRVARTAQDDVADAAGYAANAAHHVALAARYATADDNDAAREAAEAKSQADCCDVIRQYYPNAPLAQYQAQEETK